MSDELSRVDWIAAHDQTCAEVQEILRRRCPFMLLWVESEDEHEQQIGTTGMLRVDDARNMLQAFMQRLRSNDGVVPATQRPGDDG